MTNEMPVNCFKCGAAIDIDEGVYVIGLHGYVCKLTEEKKCYHAAVDDLTNISTFGTLEEVIKQS